MKSLYSMRQRDDNSSNCQCRKNDTRHKRPYWRCRWEIVRPREQNKNYGKSGRWFYFSKKSSILNGMNHPCLCHLSGYNSSSKIMKELVFITILIAIAWLVGFVIGWLARDWRVEKTDLEQVSSVVRQTMREEFTYDRQTYKFIIEE